MYCKNCKNNITEEDLENCNYFVDNYGYLFCCMKCIEEFKNICNKN